MSLLMEALRRAEEAKRNAQLENPAEDETVAEQPPAADTLSPEDARAQTAGFEAADTDPGFSFQLEPRPDLAVPDAVAPASHSALAGTDNAVAPSEPETASGTAAEESTAEAITKPATDPVSKTINADATARDKASARAVFAAKTSHRKPSPNRTLLISAAVLLPALALLAWVIVTAGAFGPGNEYQIPLASSSPGAVDQENEVQMTASDIDEPSPMSEPSDAVVTPETEAAPLSASVIPTSLLGTTALIAPQSAAEATPVAAAESPVQENITVPETNTESLVPAPAAAAREPVPSTQAQVVTRAPAPEQAIQIRRSPGIRNPDMQTMRAYSAYQQGDFAAARILYEQRLREEPDNRDALLGVAATALQQNDLSGARQVYAQLLQQNPQDPIARTGLLETTTSADPVRQESELKSLQAEYPDMAAISSALGRLYASTQRWHDAQQAYFDALLVAREQSEGAISPDYAFNLAISLERINQQQAALSYYREALAQSRQHNPGFDMNVLNQRIDVLERALP